MIVGYVHRFTETQRRMLEVLGDGQRHHCDEILQRCFADRAEPSKGMVRTQLSLMRRILRIIGEDVICEYWERRLYYRHVRMLPKSNGGSRPPSADMAFQSQEPAPSQPFPG